MPFRERLKRSTLSDTIATVNRRVPFRMVAELEGTAGQPRIAWVTVIGPAKETFVRVSRSPTGIAAHRTVVVLVDGEKDARPICLERLREWHDNPQVFHAR